MKIRPIARYKEHPTKALGRVFKKLLLFILVIIIFLGIWEWLT